MIIRRMRLNPFAGISDLEVSFEPSLNVVLGPNEAGKSTVVNALKTALFTPTKYGKLQFEKEIERFIPLAGGDTIQVQMSFVAGGRVYDLTKTWGRQAESRLSMPGGGLLADPAAVQDKLRELLVVKEGTYKGVLFAYQAGLAGTLISLRKDPEPSRDLASILRKAVFETDGVSIDGLEEAIRAEHDKYFSRWDADLRRPERGRGIENPWRRDVGWILSAYYAKERLRRDAEGALRWEEDLDELNALISAASRETEALQAFVGSNKEAVEHARRRALLEVKREAAQKEEEDLRRISLKWPALQQETKNLRENLKSLKQREETLDGELKNAQKLEGIRKKLDIFERAKKRKKDMDDARKSLSEMKPIEKNDFRALEGLHVELARLRTSLQAGTISLSIAAGTPMELAVKTDLDGESKCELKAGGSREFSAGGQIEITHSDWTMKVRSGEMDFEKLSERFKQVCEEHDRLLKRLDVADFAECKALYEEYRSRVERNSLLQAELEKSLEGEKYEELETLAGPGAEAQAVRSLAEVAAEHSRVQSEIAHMADDVREKEHQLEEWAKQYASQENLLDLLVDKRDELKKLEAELKGLRPIPAPFEHAAAFVEHFETKESELREGQNELSELRVKHARLEGDAPDESLEEIEVRLKDAQGNYERVEKEGNAIAEIMETFTATRAAMDHQTMDPWLVEMKRVVSPLTIAHYTRVDLYAAASPVAMRSDGLEVPFESLSMGTKVGLGLALRLSMAKYFLKDTDGFLVLDDPLVDMDPDRQSAAVAVIRDFARDKQVILVTCHPRHAELLGGNLIRLDLSA